MERDKPIFRPDQLEERRLVLRAAELEKWDGLSGRTFRNVLWNMGPSYDLAIDFIESGQCLEYREDFEAYLSKISLMRDFLHSSDLRQMIREGETTLAMIKPRADDVHENSQDFPHELRNNDYEATEFFIQKIQERAGKFSHLYSISMIMSPNQVELFYGNVKPRLMERYPSDWTKIWDRNVDYYTGHPITFLMIHRPISGTTDTIQWWRNQLGPTDPKDARQKRLTRLTLRAMYGKGDNLPNNLFHGSDSQQSLYDEIAMLSEFLGDWYEQIQAGLIEDEEIS